MAAVVATALFSLTAAAEAPLVEAVADTGREQVVAYPGGFFERYQPRTALDMVQRVPGFSVDDGDGTRGFGGAAGNVLINGRRPSAKQDRPSEILDRVPAAHVARIDLVRGSVDGIDLRGQSVVVNVHLRDDAPATIRWEASVRQDLRAGPLSPSGRISRTDRWRDVQYTVGLLARRRGGNVEGGRELLLDGDDALLETRLEESIDLTRDLLGSLAASRWFGENFVQVNAVVSLDSSDLREDSFRVPSRDSNREAGTDFFGTGFDRWQLELGADAERAVRPDLVANLIGLFIYEDRDGFSRQRSTGPDDALRLRRDADTGRERIEAIARTELRWAPVPEHVFQFNAEGAYNSLDSDLVLFVDAGDGPVIVDVPGANTRVEERRADVLVSDTWSRGAFEVDVGVGAEVSRISQSGDAERSRQFAYAKPRLGVTYSPDRGRQWRGRLAREVSQLDFSDFVSATNFADDDLDLGNPDLQPETKWIAELGWERRFGEIGVVRVTGYHHWISDVEDLLPITERFEAPGNIGDGRRWGLDLSTTVALSALNLDNARMDFTASWQDSRVTDPVTGARRELSEDLEYEFTVDYRQDLEARAIAWGWDASYEADRPLYKVNEFDTTQRRLAVNAFVETHRWRGLRVRLEGEHLFHTRLLRDRVVYAGLRDLSLVDFRETRKRRRGQRFTLSVSGTF